MGDWRLPHEHSLLRAKCPWRPGGLGDEGAGVLRPHRPADGQAVPARWAPDSCRSRKYPAVAGNAQGDTILVWTEGMGWNQGGSLAWQVYDKAGKPTAEKGKADGVPTWSLVAVFARPDGGFTVIY